MGSETRTTSYPAELRQRAVRMVREQEGQHVSQSAAVRSVAGEVGCHREKLRQAERDDGVRPGPTTKEREHIRAFEREVRQANEILRKASAYFAQAELDRLSKR